MFSQLKDDGHVGFWKGASESVEGDITVIQSYENTAPQLTILLLTNPNSGHYHIPENFDLTTRF